MKRRITKVAASLAWTIFLLIATVSPALAHEAPDDGAEWLMADWMLLSFLVFFSVALVAFLFAVRRGLLTNLEDAKYHILTIDEPDYYTPEWMKEAEGDDANRS